MKPIRTRIILTCATCEHETEATAVLGQHVDSRYSPMFRKMQFPRAAITGAESGWTFDEASQRALCPDHAPKEPA